MSGNSMQLHGINTQCEIKDGDQIFILVKKQCAKNKDRNLSGYVIDK